MPQALVRAIKEYALNIGFTKAGIAPADDFTEYEAIVSERGACYSFLAGNAHKCANIQQHVPQAKSIIVLAYDYMQHAIPANLSEMIGRAYLARCYNPQENSIHHSRIRLMERFLEDSGLTIVPDLFIPARWAGARAGITSFGRNTFAYVDAVGSFVILYTIVVDKELVYDQATTQCKCPPNCRACIDACPTGALAEPFRLVPQKCMAFQTFLSDSDRSNGSTDFVPLDMRRKLGTRVHGCDICQMACPRNRGKLSQKLPKEPYLKLLAEDFSLRQLLHLPDEFYQHRVQPIMYNYIRKRHLFQRNAAVAIGNTGDKSFLPDLAMEINHPEPVVRAHVAWALGRLGGEVAVRILEKRLVVETEADVRAEILSALETGVMDESSATEHCEKGSQR